MEQKQFDVIVIGAGAAGLMAALELALTGKTVAVVEAKEKAGGRIVTVQNANHYPIELGAEFVHGNLPLTKELLKKAGAKTYAVDGGIWQHKDGELKEQEDFIDDYSDLEKKFKALKEDISVGEFLSNYLADDKYEELRFSLKNYVQGYYAADINKASAFALRDELTKGDDEQYRIENGYQKLVAYLESCCVEKGVQFYYSAPAQGIEWRLNNVDVITEKEIFRGRRAVITVSIGVLQSGHINFSPALPEKIIAAQQLGFGHVVKIILAFEDAFWKAENLAQGKHLKDLNFLFSEETIPTWWTQSPKEEAVLVGWLGGPRADTFAKVDKESLVKKALSALSRIFNLDVLHLSQKLQSSYWHNWLADPAFCGAYSYEVVNGEGFMKTILEPVESTLYFAGEGLHHGPEIGTVEAALQSGRAVAHNLVSHFNDANNGMIFLHV